ncbi:MAG: class E sortase [Ilumatobacteraceae bacterium]
MAHRSSLPHPSLSPRPQAPLRLPALPQGDELIVRTDAAWFVYRLTRQRIVTPKSTWVLDPVPDPALRSTPDATPRLITIVTCTPRGTTRQRWIWWGSLSAVYPPDSPPPAIKRSPGA